jgi:hypothetical protein
VSRTILATFTTTTLKTEGEEDEDDESSDNNNNKRIPVAYQLSPQVVAKEIKVEVKNII